jgi:hypothetical protein
VGAIRDERGAIWELVVGEVRDDEGLRVGGETEGRTEASKI